tara:strand:+ start:337 stop:1059 length:723 start_codon:yes stop_codon:yes gene_type:complete
VQQLPILILKFCEQEGPGYISEFLEENSLPFIVKMIHQSSDVPDSISKFSGLILMGGPMSANDQLDWIPLVLYLIKQAYKYDKPLLGHCLGGQLISKSLGAKIKKNKVLEIGWFKVQICNNSKKKKENAQNWLGKINQFKAFHWHGETFELPNHATLLLTNNNCQNQAYSIKKHLVFQCHIEMNEDLISSWCKSGEDELFAHKKINSVQSSKQIKENFNQDCRKLNEVAKIVYGNWIKGL